MVKMVCLSLSLLLSWTEVGKTQSRRQSGLVCSLLVVSLLLSAVVGGEECVQGILPAETVNLYGSSDQVLPLPPTTRPRPRSPTVCNTPSPTSSSPAPTSEATPSAPPTQLMTVVIAVVACLVLLVVVALVLVMVIVVVVCRRRGKKNIYEDVDAKKSVRLEATQNTLQSTASYEPMSLVVGPTHFNHQPLLIHTSNTTSDNGDHISMQECPAYQPIEDTPTSGDYTYI